MIWPNLEFGYLALLPIVLSPQNDFVLCQNQLCIEKKKVSFKQVLKLKLLFNIIHAI